jgi:hypothetical protein
VNSGGALDINGKSIANALTLAGAGTSVQGGLTNSSASAATFAGNITLSDSAYIGTVGNLTVNGTINGAYSLGVWTFDGGTINLAGSIGAGTALNTFLVQDIGVAAPSIILSGASLRVTSYITLLSAITLGADTVISTNASLYASSDIDGNYDLSITAASMTLGGKIGSNAQVGALHLTSTDTSITLLNSVDYVDSINITANTSIYLGGNIGANEAVGAVNITSVTDSITVQGTIDRASGLTVSANKSIYLGGHIGSSAAVGAVNVSSTTSTVTFGAKLDNASGVTISARGVNTDSTNGGISFNYAVGATTSVGALYLTSSENVAF